MKLRTVPLAQGEQPWSWGTPSEKQCTWYVYYRAYQVTGYFPCYNDRSRKIEGYNNAKLWPQNFKEPWYPHYFADEPDIELKPGDILVFDGNYGHVAFIGKIQDYDHAIVEQYNLKAPLEFSNDVWERGGILKGYPYNTGLPKGILRFEGKKKETFDTVPRETSRDQIETTDDSLRVRTEPSLNGEIVGHVQIGYYNVLSQRFNDGYTWYEIEKDRWCANDSVIYLPATEDVVRKIEEYIKAMKDEINTLSKERDEYRNTLDDIHRLSEVKDE